MNWLVDLHSPIFMLATSTVRIALVEIRLYSYRDVSSAFETQAPSMRFDYLVVTRRCLFLTICASLFSLLVVIHKIALSKLETQSNSMLEEI